MASDRLYSNTDQQIDSVDAIRQAVQTLVIEARASKDKLKRHDHLVIFIHGFNNDQKAIDDRGHYFDKALGTDQVITTAFNWKSCASIYGYYKDQQTATECGPYFALYLHEIRNNKIHKFNQIDIIAHSMGNHLLVECIDHCNKNNKLDIFKGSNIVAVAADVETKKYETAVNLLLDEHNQIAAKWIHYWNSTDAALILSKFANAKQFFGIIIPSTRVGTSDCSIRKFGYHSCKWDEKLSHGYVDSMFDDDKPLSEVLKEWLSVETKQSQDNKDDIDEKGSGVKHMANKPTPRTVINGNKSGVDTSDPEGLLRSWGLERYSDKLVDEFGWDNTEDWKSIKLDYLTDKDKIGMKDGHAQRFVNKVIETFSQ